MIILTIQEMTLRRLEYLELLYRDSKQIRDLFLKCVLYSGCCTKTHWICELVTFLYSANKVSCKVELDEEYYECTVFAKFGASEDDCEIMIENFCNDYCKHGDYGDYLEFKIDDAVIKHVHAKMVKFLESSIAYLSDRKIHSMKDWKNLLDKII